ncbi:hypothetical protein AwErysi_07740 [Erysipelotrichaceae bacterium]|nr:hypothetical protein AwErysi_07740 [Erysipelotrichaceae bacterium]
MKKVKILCYSLLIISGVVCAIGYTIFNMADKETTSEESIFENDESIFGFLADAAEIRNDLGPQQLTETIQITQATATTTISHETSNQAAEEFCQGANFRKLTLENTGKQEVEIKSSMFYYYDDDNMRVYAVDRVSAKEYGAYTFNSPPLLIEPGKNLEYNLVFEYTTPLIIIPNNTMTVEEEEYHKRRPLYFQLNPESEEQTLEKHEIIISCTKSEEDMEVLGSEEQEYMEETDKLKDA